MNLKRIKWFVAVAVLAFPVVLSAQTPANEFGVFVSRPAFDSTRFVDFESGDDFELEFDENAGYGVNFTHSFSPQVSLELTAQKMSGDVQVSLDTPPITVNAGEINLMAYSATAQWHFAGTGKFDPYVGAGVAYVTGDVDFIDDPEDPDATSNSDLENETTWLANAGIAYRISNTLSIGADAKYITYEPKAEDDVTEDRVDINPLVISAGVKFRF
jgi:outer membrane protein